MRNVCRSLRAIPTPGDLRTSGRAFPDDHSHAGFPQGFLTRRILTFVSFYVWLTNAINRIVKEHGAAFMEYLHPLFCKRVETYLPRARLASRTSHRRHRPVQGCFWATQPGRLANMVLFVSLILLPASGPGVTREAKAILTEETRRSTPYPEISSEPGPS
jgi:hypothetical protein